MIYQNIKLFVSQNKGYDYINKFLNKTIDDPTITLQEKVEDIISLHLEYTKDENLSKITSEGYYRLFENGQLTWHIMKNLYCYSNIERTIKKKISDINIFKLFDLIERPFHSFFFIDLNNNSLHLRKLSNQAIAANLLTNKEIKDIWDIFNLNENNSFLNDFLVGIKNFTQMETICSITKLTPWQIVKKENKIETFWATNVWALENAHALKIKTRSTFEYRNNLFLKNKHIWKQISSFDTDIIDLQSRIVFASANMKNEHQFNLFLNDLDIKKVNFDCLDYIVSPNKTFSLKERLFQQGKIKTINKYDKKNYSDTDITKLITSVPAKAELISNKKGFLKQWLKSKGTIDNYESILISVLNSKFKKYTDSSFDIKCFFPIKKDFADYNETFWNENKNRQNNYFLNFQEFNHNVSFDSFANLLTWLDTKNINWNLPYKNNFLLGETIVSCLSFKYAYSLDSLGNDNNILLIQFKKSSDEMKISILENIKNSWVDIWTKDKEKEHDNYIINSPFKRESICINIFSQIIQDIAKNNIVIPNSFFDSEWENIKTIIQKYSVENKSAKDFLIASSFIEMHSQLNKKNDIIKKVNKI